MAILKPLADLFGYDVNKQIGRSTYDSGDRADDIQLNPWQRLLGGDQEAAEKSFRRTRQRSLQDSDLGGLAARYGIDITENSTRSKLSGAIGQAVKAENVADADAAVQRGITAQQPKMDLLLKQLESQTQLGEQRLNAERDNNRLTYDLANTRMQQESAANIRNSNTQIQLAQLKNDADIKAAEANNAQQMKLYEMMIDRDDKRYEQERLDYKQNQQKNMIGGLIAGLATLGAAFAL